jgi:hypothetical protein
VIPYPLHRVTFSDNLRHYPGLRLTPGAPYWCTASLVRQIRKLEEKTGIQVATVTREEPPIRRWQGGRLAGRVGYFRSGHIGDAIADTAALEQLYHDHPQAEFHVFAEHPTADVWLNQRSVRQVHPFQLAIPEAEMLSMDWWILPRPLPYLRKYSNRNYYDLLGESLGIDIEVQRPRLTVTGDIRNLTRERFAHYSGMAGGTPQAPVQILDRPYIYVQTTSLDANRTPGGIGSGEYWYERIAGLIEALPGYWFLMAGDLDKMPDLWRLFGSVAMLYHMDSASRRGKGDVPGDWWRHPQLPFTFEMVRGARAVVSPDSAGLHIAAAFDRPTLGLFNMRGVDRVPSPESRISTYPHAVALDMDSSVGEFVEGVKQLLD